MPRIKEKINSAMEKIEIDDFSLKDKSKINFWLSMVEKYNYDKVVSICLRAGTTPEIAEKIANEVDSNFNEEDMATISMSEIRRLIFALLYKYDWAAAKRFKTEEVYIRTSAEKFEVFDRSKISRSLIKETGISEEQADSVSMDVEKFIKNLNLTYISSPLIREIANVKLLEYGLEDARKKYTRIGIPIYDVEQMISKGVSTNIKRENANLQHTPETINWIISGETLEQYATLKLFPQNLVDSHISGDYHIHILSSAATRPNCIQHYTPLFFKHGLKVDGTGMHTSVAGPAKHLSVAIQHSAKILLAAQSVSYDEPLIFKRGNEIKIEQIGLFVEKILEGKINLEKCECLAFNSKGKIEWSKISNVYRHKPNTMIYKIKTKSGKEIKTTGYHSIFSLRKGKIVPVIVEDLKKDDDILLPAYLPSQENLREIDLTDFFKDEAENYSVTNIKEILKRINKSISYREIAKLLGVSRKKALSYSDKNSMPLSKFLIIKNYALEDDNIKIKCRIGGSTSSLNSKVKLEKPFIKLLAYIIADGHISNVKYRRYISIFPFDDKLAEEIIDYCKLLNIKASYHKERGEITICNFILLRIILKLVKGETSKTKQIPNLVFSLPFEQKFNFLSAYINSDGYVSRTKPAIGISSVNKEIINSLSYLCLSLGIPFSIKELIRDVELKGRIYKNHKIYKLLLKAIRINRYIYSNLALFGDKQERLTEKLKSNQRLICKQKYFGNLVLDEVANIEILQPDNFVYDLEVPGKQNFVCGFGGVCAHNTQMAGGQSIDCFNIWLAPFAKGLNDEQIKQAVQEFIYELNQSYVARGGQVVFSNINWEFGIPEWLKNVPAIGPGGKEMGVYGDYEEESLKILREYIKVKIKGDHAGKQHMWPNDVFKVRKDTFQKYPDELMLVHEFMAKYGTPYIANGLPEWQTENFNYMGCRTRLDSKYAGPWGTLRTGNDIYITLNLPRIAYEARGNDEKFFELLDKRLGKMAEILIIKHKTTDDLLHKQNLLKFLSQKFGDEEYYQLLNTTKTFGYAGLTEATKFHTGSHLHENPDAQNFGIKVIKIMREYANKCAKEYGLRFSVIASPAETCAARLVKLDMEKFGRNVIFSGSKDAPYYTNSHMVKMDANFPLAEKINIEEKYHPLTNGGHILHIWLGESYPSIESLFELTKKICKTNIGFFGYTKDYSVCNSCFNFEYGLKSKCGNCGSEELSRYSRVTGYYQRVEGWNPSKKQELKDRFRYNSDSCNCN